MSDKPNVHRFDQVFVEHVQMLSETEKIADLVYFFQFRQIHLETMAEGGYHKLAATFDNLHAEKPLSVFANYASNLIARLQAETNPIRQIELRIAFSVFADYFAQLGAAFAEDRQ